MALEPTFNNIDDLVAANPADTDNVSEGDNHLRGIKSALKGNVTGNATETRLLVSGSPMLTARANGADLLGTVAPDLVDNGNAFNIGTLAGAHLAMGPAAIQGKGSATASAALAINPLGGAVTTGSASGGSGQFRADAPAGADVSYRLYENAVQQASLWNDASLNAIRMQIGGSATVFRVEDASKIAAVFTPAAGQTIRHNNVQVLETTAEGLKAAATSQNTALAAIASTTTNEARLIAANARGGVILFADATGDYIRLGQTTAAGVYEKYWQKFNRNGGIEFYHNNTKVAETISTGLIVGTGSAANLQFNRNGNNYIDLTGGTGATLRIRNSAAADVFYLDTDAFTRLYYNAVRALDTADPATYSTSIRIIHDDGSTYPGGLNLMPGQSIASATTIGIEHMGKLINMNSSITRVFTVPSSVMNGFTCTLMVTNGGVARFTEASGVTLHWQDGAGGQTGQRDVVDGGVVTLYQRTADTWYIWGSGIT